MDRAQKRIGRRVVARCDTQEVLDCVEETLDETALSIQYGIDEKSIVRD